jgi:hypothetical protein
MNIKIDIKNLAKIQAALDECNGSAVSHTFASASEIIQRATHAEQQLENLHLPKISRQGAEATATSGSKVARSYNYERIINCVKMERKSSAWFLVEVEKFMTWLPVAGRTSITLTPEQDKKAVAEFRIRYAIAR